MLEPWVLGLLALAGFAAGFVDAIAGGGGTISVPALLAAGVPPVAALGTNKLQSIIGTLTAAITYWRKGYIDLRTLAPSIVVTFIGAALGAIVVKQIDTSTLSIAIPILLVAVAIYFVLAPRLTDDDKHARLSWTVFVPLMGIVVGFYDGVFGPGAGSFFTIGFVALFGLGITRAAGHTKALNLVSNFGALVVFMVSGNVIWPAAIVMAIAQIAGGYLGAHTGIRYGARLIRPMIVVVNLIVAAKLIFFR